LLVGRYDVGVRTQDFAGNWSVTSTGTLQVFDPTGPMDFTASKQVVPVYGTDVLPGLTNDPHQNDKADLSFDVTQTPSGTINPTTSILTLGYATGNGCDPVKHPEKCNSILDFTANMTSPNAIDWLVLNGANSSLGSFQGTGTLSVNGAVTHNPFKVQGTDGNRTTPLGNDDVTLSIYAVGDDPTTAVPIYHLHIGTTGNWLKIQ